MTAQSAWEPPTLVSFDEVLKINDEVSAKAGAPIEITEDIFRIHELAMDWDIGVVRYEPKDKARIPRRRTARKLAFFSCTAASRTSSRSNGLQNLTREVRHSGGDDDFSRSFLFPRCQP